MFGGLTHGPAVELARLLVELTPPGLEHVFLCDSGSVSVEVAIKMCLQYQRARGRPGKHRLHDLARRLPRRHVRRDERLRPGRRHARAVARRAAAAGVRRALRLPRSSTATSPSSRELVETHADELAAVIVEPVVQGAGGMRFHDPRYLHVLRELCLTHDVLLVFDEIATGFGRTGVFFAAEHAGVAPDVMCVGKALTGGYLSMAAALCSTEVAAAGHLRRRGRARSCTARRSWATRSPPRSRSRRCGCCWSGGGAPRCAAIEAALRAGLAPARALPGVVDVRVLGAIGVVQLDHPVDVAAATAAAVERGRVAAPVPRPGLHDAALRVRSRRPRGDRRGRAGGGRRRLRPVTGPGDASPVMPTSLTSGVRRRPRWSGRPRVIGCPRSRPWRAPGPPGSREPGDGTATVRDAVAAETDESDGTHRRTPLVERAFRRCLDRVPTPVPEVGLSPPPHRPVISDGPAGGRCAPTFPPPSSSSSSPSRSRWASRSPPAPRSWRGSSRRWSAASSPGSSAGHRCRSPGRPPG